MDVQPFYTSFIATIAFGILFNVPKKSIFTGGLIGMLGWVVYSGCLTGLQAPAVFATFLGSFTVALFSQVFAKIRKMPVTVYSVAGIIPLVPGGLAYSTMRHFVENDYNTAIQLAAKTFMVSGAIAFGLVISGLFFQMRNRRIS